MPLPAAMKGLWFDGALALRELPLPVPRPGEALVRVERAGICGTDLEITRGYVPGFAGVPGHEFVGRVVAGADEALAGRRVVAEINCGCGSCAACLQGDPRHCPHRGVIGIRGRDGAFAEYVAVPRMNLLPVPDSVPAGRALFAEPLAAALAILETVEVGTDSDVLVIGDGRLGQLATVVLATTGCRLAAAGKHAHKLARMARAGAQTFTLDGLADAARRFDVVVEASGSPAGLGMALAACRPRGSVVLKSTVAAPVTLDATRLVVDELRIIGSRCGRLADALDFMRRREPPLETLIDATYPLADGVAAFAHAAGGGGIKTVLEMATAEPSHERP